MRPTTILGRPVSRFVQLAVATGVLGAVLAVPAPVPAQEKPPADMRKRVEESVERGLEWLKKTQAPDGHWAAQGTNYRVAMTALAGMCFLMEGSSLKEGKYSDQVRKAVEWLISPARQQPNGLIADSRSAGDFGSYMHGHGYATLFLACTIGEEEDKEQREKLAKAVKKASDFICKAQTNRKHRKAEGKEVEIGGWGYTSSTDNNNFDEGSVTITQLQALRAARNAGIEVPKANLDRAVAYLEACTTPRGGLIYSYANSGGVARSGGECTPITAAAVSCSFSAGQYKGETAQKWIKFCKDNISYAKGRVAHDEYQSYYFAQCVYVLGDDRYGEMFPKEDKSTWLTWSMYKEAMYPYLIDSQDKNSGAWNGSYISPVFSTSVNLTILQLEKGILPIYQR